MRLHIWPLNDEQEHLYQECPCDPQVDFLDPETGMPWASGNCRVWHHAFDGREACENLTGCCVDEHSQWELRWEEEA